MNGKKLIIPALLTLFLVTTCQEPFDDRLPSSDPGNWDRKPQGTPLYVYLDGNYNVEQSGTDTGRMAVFVDENPLAEGVLIVAEQSAPEYDDVIHLINRNTDTIISVFFHKNQRFPWLISIDNLNRTAEARHFGYKYELNGLRLSLEFEENGISAVAENIWLSPNTLTSYQSLSREQDVRLRNIYAALVIYESISRSFPDNGKVFLNARNTEGVLASAFTDSSFAAFATSVKPTRPMISAEEYVSGESPAYFFNKIVEWFISLFGGGSSSPPAPQPAPPPLFVTITTNGKMICPETVLYVERGGEITIDFKFDGFTQNTNVLSAFYDMFYYKYGSYDSVVNGGVYTVTQTDGSPIGKFTENYSIKLKRNMITGDGMEDGTAGLVIFFGQNAVVNGSSSGIFFREPCSQEAEMNQSVFLIKYTVQADQAIY